VRVTATLLDLPAQLGAAPGDFTSALGSDADGRIVQFGAVAIFEVVVETADGRPAKLAHGQLAQVEVPIPAAYQSRAAESAKLFGFDSVSGRWTAAGVLERGHAGGGGRPITPLYTGAATLQVPWQATDPIVPSHTCHLSDDGGAGVHGAATRHCGERRGLRAAHQRRIHPDGERSDDTAWQVLASGSGPCLPASACTSCGQCPTTTAGLSPLRAAMAAAGGIADRSQQTCALRRSYLERARFSAWDEPSPYFRFQRALTLIGAAP
jgi:hypothetical protein